LFCFRDLFWFRDLRPPATATGAGPAAGAGAGAGTGADAGTFSRIFFIFSIMLGGAIDGSGVSILYK
jgi:hypothetical protein